jgi:hypothetical protein
MNPCNCSSPGWCSRHFQNKDHKQWLMCLKHDGHRHSLDSKYGVSPDLMTDDQKESVQRHIDAENSLRKFAHDYDPDILKSCKILLLGHKEDQYSGEARDYLDFLLLQDLDLGRYKQYQKNCFSESRIFLSEAPEAEYIGVVTASWNRKFEPNKIDDFHNWENTKILFNSGDKNLILAAERSQFKHNCIFDVFQDREKVEAFQEFAISITGEICNFGLWANQIICHRSVYLRLQEFYRRVFPLVVEEIHSYDIGVVKSKHGKTNGIYSGEGFDNRKAGLFFEFLTNIWFASQKEFIILPNCTRKDDWYCH